MKLQFTKKCLKKINEHSKNKSVKVQLHKQLKLFSQDPLHPGLKLHRLKGKRSTQKAIWIHGNLRLLVIKDNDVYIFTDIITHDEY